MLVTKVLERFGVEEAPSGWFPALRPAHDFLPRAWPTPTFRPG